MDVFTRFSSYLMLFIDPFFLSFSSFSLARIPLVSFCAAEEKGWTWCGPGLAEWNPRWEPRGRGENKEQERKRKEDARDSQDKEQKRRGVAVVGWGVRGTAFSFVDVAFVIFSVSSLLTTIFFF